MSSPPTSEAFTMSTIESIMSLVSALSLSEKLQLNAALATSMAGKEVSSRKGKPAAPGTKAWTAFVAHVQSTMPERFAPPAAPKDRMVIAKAIKDEDPTAYKSFCEQYVAAHPAPAESDAESVAPSVSASASASASAEKPKRVISEEQKARMKAGREKAAAAKKEAIAAGTLAPKAKATKATPKPAPKASVGGSGSAPAPKASVGGSVPAPKASVGGSVPAPAVEAEAEEDTGMEKIKIGGDLYYLCTANNNLYSVEPDGLGAYVGRYQPGSDDEIDFEADEAE